LQAAQSNVIPVLIIGTSVIVVLIAGLFFFVIVYQRKMIKNQVELRRLEDAQQQPRTCTTASDRCYPLSS
jgi:hypothetical protein